MAQIAGGVAGVVIAHVMFNEPLLAASHHVRAGYALCVSEFVATFGLLSVILGCRRHRSPALPFAVGGYIAAAYWFTASTSFANPAVTLARSLTDTFTGIRPADVPGFIAAQLLGTGTAAALFHWLLPTARRRARDSSPPGEESRLVTPGCDGATHLRANRARNEVRSKGSSNRHIGRAS